MGRFRRNSATTYIAVVTADLILSWRLSNFWTSTPDASSLRRIADNGESFESPLTERPSVWLFAPVQPLKDKRKGISAITDTTDTRHLSLLEREPTWLNQSAHFRDSRKVARSRPMG